MTNRHWHNQTWNHHNDKKTDNETLHDIFAISSSSDPSYLLERLKKCSGPIWLSAIYATTSMPFEHSRTSSPKRECSFFKSFDFPVLFRVHSGTISVNSVDFLGNESTFLCDPFARVFRAYNTRILAATLRVRTGWSGWSAYFGSNLERGNYQTLDSGRWWVPIFTSGFWRQRLVHSFAGSRDCWHYSE